MNSFLDTEGQGTEVRCRPQHPVVPTWPQASLTTLGSHAGDCELAPLFLHCHLGLHLGILLVSQNMLFAHTGHLLTKVHDTQHAIGSLDDVCCGRPVHLGNF
eukprot:14581119-Alexandrium_andersonii.AAC.1